MSEEYSAGEPREGRLARALHVDMPVWRQLGDAILSDFNDHVCGVGWWAPEPGTSRRILMSDHLYNCVRSVEANLIEARLHLFEAMDCWERESDFHARAVSVNTDGTLKVEMPDRRRPLDEITSTMGTLHIVGFIRAIAGALDCFGASVVGVTAVRANSYAQISILRAGRSQRSVGRTQAKRSRFGSERNSRRSLNTQGLQRGFGGWSISETR